MASNKTALKKQLVAYSFIAPNFIGFAVFTLVPIIFAFVLAFLHWDGANPIRWAGLSNFIALFDDDQFKAALKNTIVYTGGTVPLTLVGSLLLAVILNKKIRGRNFFRTVSFFPYVASLVAVAALWNMMFNTTKGPVNMMLHSLGFKNVPGWAADRHWAMPTVIFFSVWKYVGYYMIIYLAGLQSISAELYEAADLDGANGWQVHLHHHPQPAPPRFLCRDVDHPVFQGLRHRLRSPKGTGHRHVGARLRYLQQGVHQLAARFASVAMVLFLLVMTVP